jgi:ABC-2 type transport system ATP-binding protein
MLTAHHLTRRFHRRLAVDDVSFDIARGEIFALLGPNGAGKTTILRLLAGLIQPSSGSVTIDGETLGPDTASRLRTEIGFLTEAPGLWERLTVRDNLTVYARLYGMPSPAAVVDQALDLFDMRARARQRAAELSKGLRHRVALARALIHNPRIVLLDEPTAGLDPESARDVRLLILRLRDADRAILLSTHNLDEVERVADRVAVLRARLVAVDRPAALRARLFETRVRITLSEPAHSFADALATAGFDNVTCEGRTISVALAGQRTTPQLVRRLVEAGAPVESVSREEASLEQVYLKLLQEGAPAS